jgi:hypothetical protein
MVLTLKDNLSKEKGVPIFNLIPGEIFIDSDGDYCMRVNSEYDEDGRLITAVAVSGLSVGALVAYEEATCVIPVKAELSITGYV